MNLPPFLTAPCPACGCRYGWAGKAIDRPSCPQCKAEPDVERLFLEYAVYGPFEEFLAKRRERMKS